MLYLKSLQEQLEALQTAYDQEINAGKTFGEVKEIYLQIKQIKQLIYERKIFLKREGKYQP